MSLASVSPSTDEHLAVEPREERVAQLRGWLRRARARAAVVLAEAHHAIAEAERVEAALALAERDLSQEDLQ
jgi:hypothetical protein